MRLRILANAVKRVDDMTETILITGGNRGIGRQMALEAQRRGMAVIAAMRNPDTCDLPDEVRRVALNVTDPGSCAAMAETIGKIALDIVVCNAGVYPARGGMDDAPYDEDDWQTGLMTNVAGPFFTVRALLQQLRLSERPRIAIISSRMGSNTASRGGSYVYRASKAGATNLASNLANDLSGDGIAVAAYHPGWVRTDMGGSSADVGAEDSASGLLDQFAVLRPEPTGQFLNFTGEPIPY